MWRRHWQLSGDPFLGAASPFVRTPTHAEALARLSSTIEGNQRLAILSGAEGLGTSAVLEALVNEIRGPRRRIARVRGPVDGLEMFKGIANGLGVRIEAGRDRAAAWKAVVNAIRLCHWQKQQVVLMIDDAQTLDAPADVRDLERLCRIDLDPATPISVIVCLRESVAVSTGTLGGTDWLLAIRLMPLTRSETIQFVTEKLNRAGRSDPAFTPRALTRLHDLSEGVPRGLDRLASLALMAGAARGLELIPPDVIDGVARECVRSEPWEETAA